MVRLAEIFSDSEILQTLCAKLSWSHFKDIIYIDEPLKRNFYIEMCRVEGWSVRTLRKKINSMLYERTAISKQPDEVISHELKQLQDTDKLFPNLVFHDPYFLDFLGLNDRYLEKDLEDAILRELESFLLELGQSGIHVAEYLTELPPRELLKDISKILIFECPTIDPSSNAIVYNSI